MNEEKYLLFSGIMCNSRFIFQEARAGQSVGRRLQQTLFRLKTTAAVFCKIVTHKFVHCLPVPVTALIWLQQTTVIHLVHSSSTAKFAYSVIFIVIVECNTSISQSSIKHLIICPIAVAYSMGQITSIAQPSQRDRAARWVSYGQKWKTGTGRQYFTDIGLPSTTLT